MALPILGILGNLIGIGGNVLKNKSKLKELKQNQEHAIIKAETEAVVNRILNNTQSDNEIDLITARNKRFSSKDEVVTYLFLVPIFIATLTPFIIAYQNNSFENMNKYIRESYESLNQLPEWYRWILGLIIIDVFGFRSFARKIIDKWSSKIKLK